MVSAVPQPQPPPQQPATAAAAGAPQAQFTSTLVANNVRFMAVMDRLALHFKGTIRCQLPELCNLCFVLAKSIDYAITINDIPAVAHCLPPLIKQVYQHRNDLSLQSAIMVLMIAAKNACKNGWFHGADADELLTMANELSGSFCMTMSVTSEAGNVLDTISKIFSRFYPRLNFCRLIASFEAKPGYDILMADFHISRNRSLEERIRLFVAQKDSIETSSCIISPPQVSFLVNGKGVERRTNVSPDNGPQYPTDITKLLKYGTNIIQAIGYFSSNYIIAVAYMTDVALSAPALKDYVPPIAGALSSDSDITEGPSRISLNCPISFRRIKTPVKGHLCKHRQCFDYDNFMEMNSRKPSWRCPFCNQPVCFIDLRIDQSLNKILGQVGQDVADVVISSDGSWKVLSQHNQSADQLHDETHDAQQDSNIECESNRISNTLPDVIDLTTMEIDGENDNAACETEDRKPFKDIQGFLNSEVCLEPLLANPLSLTTQSVAQHMSVDISHGVLSSAASNGSTIPISRQNTYMAGTLESLLPVSVLNPVITDAITPAPTREPAACLGNFQSTLPWQNTPQVGQYAGNMQLQQSQLGNPIISTGAERSLIPRHVNRVPTAVQALPVQSQAPGLSQRTRTNVFNSSSLNPSGSSLASYQTTALGTATQARQNAENWNSEMQQISRTSTMSSSFMQPHSVTQVHDHQEHMTNPLVQQVVGLAAANPISISTRTLPIQQRGMGAYRSMSQLPSDIQSPRNQLPYSRVHPVTMPLNSSRLSSMQIPQATQNTAVTTAGSLANVQTQQSAQHAAHAVRLQAGDAVYPPASRAAVSVPELPSEQNWRPTGRMRGSLTGSAYSAALSQYLSPLVRPAAARQPVSPSEQLSALIANSMKAHGPVSQQANLNLDDGGN